MSTRARTPRPRRTAAPAIDEGQCRTYVPILEFIGRRWMAAILLAGAHGAVRFADYRESVVGISDRLLTVRLRELQERELLRREVIPTTPVQIRYRPTEEGLELVRAIQPLLQWSRRPAQEQERSED
ncbi:winged helix-turn-helix transcriptional regulator [Prauserella cavernicola]|uniref:Helix-turn-helix transcriptional regulator n=1 Tax=Prauserella cavernicola TaxID=2800127 RepID=A0A934QYE1_9PSEU|nr:helix-turn-helix domain-containing protein [Prauserella cavernicola]MBK1787553.1 helix-turn-helix transcriptional regulator [Prauserella cavernicola]